MITTILSLIVLVITSLAIVGFNYLHIPLAAALQIISVLLLVLVFVSRKYLFSDKKQVLGRSFRLFFLLLSSLFVQMLVSFTGSFFSPFLITLHLFALGLSFLVNIQVSIAFITLSVMSLLFSIYLNASLSAQMQQDPFSVVLYIASFIVIVPLSIILTRTYHVKDRLSELLSNTVAVSSRRERLILGGLNELVFVTDTSLRIISANEAAEQILGMSSEEMANHPLTEMVPIKDANNLPATAKSFSIDQALADKATRVISGFSLYPKTRPQSFKISVQVGSIVGLNGQINQFVFVINEASLTSTLKGHTNLEAAFAKNKGVISSLKKALSSHPHTRTLQLQLDLLDHSEDDLVIAQEMEDHPIKEVSTEKDLAQLCKNAVESRKAFAKSLDVNLEFILPGDAVAEISFLDLKQQNLLQNELIISEFSAIIDEKWVVILIQKLIEISILQTAGLKLPRVQLLINKTESDFVDIKISSRPTSLNQLELVYLYKEYYPTLVSKTNLKLGSGLEGFIAKSIVNQLGISLDINLAKTEFTVGVDSEVELLMHLKFSRQAKKT